MFIEPIQVIENLSQLNGDKQKVRGINKNAVGNNVFEVPQEQKEDGVVVPFKSLFQGAIEDVKATDRQINIDTEMLATGKSDNLHQYGIDIAKAQLSIDLLVEMRNRALDAYNEVMRMGI